MYMHMLLINIQVHVDPHVYVCTCCLDATWKCADSVETYYTVHCKLNDSNCTMPMDGANPWY